MTRLFSLSSLFLIALSPILSAQDSSPSSCPCTFRGVVVDSVTGLPVRNALVEASSGSPNATLTDSEGSFHFDGLPAGAVSISAMKPGFLAENPLIARFSSFQVAPGAPPALIKLVPGGVITGRVVDDRGEPLDNFRVELLRRAPNDGDLFVFNFQLGQSILTNDLGVFRIPDLPAGSYFLAVSPPKTQAYSAAAGETPLGYPRVYYPGVFDHPSATALRVSAGQETHANLTITARPAVRLSGTISGYSSSSYVTISLNAGWPNESIPVNFDLQTGSFQTGWLPPGKYNFSAYSNEPQAPNDPSASRFASQSVIANINLSGIHLALASGLNIPVFVHGLPPETVQVMIYANSKGSGHSGQAIGPTRELGKTTADTYTLILPAGTYWLDAHAYISEPYYVESATFGSANLLTDDLVVDSSAANSSIDVVFRKGAATLSGAVSMKDSSHSAYVVLFTPGQRQTPLFQSVEMNGSFKFEHLAPGTYRIAAFDGLIDPDSSNQELVKKLSAVAKEVSLVPEQSLFLTLDVGLVGE
jgi:hypothetical protein